MATEEELEQARRAHAESLRAAGTQPYPNDFRPSAEQQKQRALALELLNDPSLKGVPAEGERVVDRRGARLVVEVNGERRERFPQDDELTGEEPRFPIYGRVVAKRGPFLVIQTPHGAMPSSTNSSPPRGMYVAISPPGVAALRCG